MHWVLYFTFAWIIITYFVTRLQKNEALKSVVIYMAAIMLISLSYGILSNNMKLIDVTEDKLKFLDLLLQRLVITPFLLLSLISKYNNLSTYVKKALSVITLLALLMIFEFMDIKMQLYRYTRWSLLSSMLLNCFIIFIALIINKYFYIVEQWGENN